MTTWEVRIGGESFRRWTQIQVDADLLSPADGWAVSLSLGDTRDPEERRALDRLIALRPPLTAEIWREDVQLLTGVWDGRTLDATRQGGTTIVLEGRDVAAYLVDSSVPLGLTVSAETLFLDLLTAAIRPWDLTLTTDATAARQILTGMTRTERRDRMLRERAIDRGVAATLYQRELDAAYARASEASIGEDGRPSPVAGRGTPAGPLLPALTDEEILNGLADGSEVALLRSRRRYASGLSPRDVETLRVREARPHPGETVWSFLARHASRLGLMLWASPDGRIVASAPNYASEAVQRIVRRKVNDPSDPNNVLAGGGRFDAAGVYSKVVTYGRTGGTDASRSRFRGTAADDSVPWPRVRIVHDAGIRSQDEADRRAKREARLSSMRSKIWTYTVVGHDNAGRFWAPDTMVHVEDEIEGLSEPLYVFRRTLLSSKAEGETTRLYLVPSGAIAL